MSFSNKVVIVTGGGSGIGAATAVLFAKEGANVAIVGRNEEKLKQVAAEITKLGRNALIIKADLNKDEEVKQIIDKTVEKFGKINVLINNAGIVHFGTIGDENYVQNFDKIMSTNLRSVVLLTNLSVPYLKKTKGNIVNISSVAGDMTSANIGAYCTSKAALNHFSKNCALELAEFGVRVNIISPGPVKTNILEAAGVNTDFRTLAENSTALKILTMPEEVADLAVYLASDKARSVTGSNYTIDAGAAINSNNQIPASEK